MRATIRLADGSLVEGDVVSMGHWLPPAVANGCAGNPSVVYGMQLSTAAVQIIPSDFWSTRTPACAAIPSAYLWHQD